MDKRKRFRCGNSSICLDEKQLCDKINDCPGVHFDDEQLLCPWLSGSTITNVNQKYFTCRNNLILPWEKRCDATRNCPHGEDEDFCWLAEPPRKNLNLFKLLSDMAVYPSTMAASTSLNKQSEFVESSTHERYKIEIHYSDLDCTGPRSRDFVIFAS